MREGNVSEEGRMWEVYQCGRELCGRKGMWEGAVSEKPNQETEERWPLK